MNARDKEGLLEILKYPKLWSKDLEELDYAHACTALMQYREWLFFHSVFIPVYNHAVGLLRAVSSEEDRAHFVWDENLWDCDEGGWAIWDCDQDVCRVERVVEDLQIYISDRLQSLYNDEWCCDVPTLEEMLALNVRPPLVAEKADALGNVQLSMF